MDQEQFNILQALQDTLRNRDKLSVSLIDDNIRFQLKIKYYREAITAQREKLDEAITSLRHSPAGYSSIGQEIVRTLVLISNSINHLTSDEHLDKKVGQTEP